MPLCNGSVLGLYMHMDPNEKGCIWQMGRRLDLTFRPMDLDPINKWARLTQMQAHPTQATNYTSCKRGNWCFVLTSELESSSKCPGIESPEENNNLSNMKVFHLPIFQKVLVLLKTNFSI